MEGGSKCNNCDTKGGDIIAIDGTHVRTCCGLVLDQVCFEEPKPSLDWNNNNNNNNNINDDVIESLCEYSERGAIDDHTRSLAQNIYYNFTSKHSSLHKNTLLATSIYIACKQNQVPRTMKEICSLTGCEIKSLGRYEKLVSEQHFPTNASDYIDRFGCKLHLKFQQIRKVKSFLRSSKINQTFSPVNVAAAALYKILQADNLDMCDIVSVTGVPSATIHRIVKYI